MILDKLKAKYDVLMQECDSLEKLIYGLENGLELDIKSSMLSKKISDFHSNALIKRCLRLYNIVYMHDLIGMSEKDLLLIPGFGRKSLNEVKDMLAQVGLQLEKGQ